MSDSIYEMEASELTMGDCEWDGGCSRNKLVIKMRMRVSDECVCV